LIEVDVVRAQGSETRLKIADEFLARACGGLRRDENVVPNPLERERELILAVGIGPRGIVKIDSRVGRRPGIRLRPRACPSLAEPGGAEGDARDHEAGFRRGATTPPYRPLRPSICS
jgi:hypothetical protein